MRERIQRGKRTDNGEWVRGNYGLFHARDGVWVHEIYVTDPAADELYWNEVDPETVGDYTGVPDKNGVKIFEGDILVVRNLHDGHDRYWNQPCGPAIPTPVLWDCEWLAWDIPYDSYNFEVIGNIHDNPELIKEESK